MKLSLILVISVVFLILMGCTDETTVTVINHTNHNAEITIDSLVFNLSPNYIAQKIIEPDTLGREGGTVQLEAVIEGNNMFENPYLDPGDNFVWNLYSGMAYVTVFNHTNVLAAVMLDTNSFSLNPNQAKTNDIEWFGSLLELQQVSLTATLDETEVFSYPYLQHGDTYIWNIYSGTAFIEVINNSDYLAMVTIADEANWGLSSGHSRLFMHEWYGTELDSMDVKLYATIDIGSGTWDYYDYPQIADGEHVQWIIYNNEVHDLVRP